MKYELKLIDQENLKDIHEMYQDIPLKELGSTNMFYGINFDDFCELIKICKTEEKVINKELNTTTNRYIFFVNKKPIGELGIRTTLNDFWINKGSQIFYKIRESERSKGYGSKLLELGLKKCKKLGMKQIRINCDDTNLSSKKIIIKNGGKLDIKSYKTKDGYSSSYIINLN